MCGRFTNQFTWRELVELYQITERYIRLDKEERREPAMMRWGLVPSWAKDEKGGAKCINAKAETVSEKPAFRAAFMLRPCLVPADGFYEWAKAPDGKQPYYITTRWRPKAPGADEPPLDTFTILTTEPKTLCAPIHNRMPVILAREDWAGWLGTPDDRMALMARGSFPAERMECWKVGKAVGNVKNEGAALIERVAA